MMLTLSLLTLSSYPAGVCGSVVECVPGLCQALEYIPSTTVN